MNFFNNTATTSTKKTISVTNEVGDPHSGQRLADNDRLKNNLSWSESVGTTTNSLIINEDTEDLIFDPVPQARDLLDPTTTVERTIASMFSTSPQHDSSLVLLLKALEVHPRQDAIDKQRKIYEENIEKLRKAKNVLSAVTTIAQGVNPEAVKAYTSTEAALNEAIISRDKFESELRSSGQSVKQLIGNCKSNTEESRVAEGIVSLFGFTEVS